MTLLGTGFRRILILLFIAVAIIMIALNIILNIKLRSEIPSLITQFSDQIRYDINVEQISLDPFFRLQLDEVSILDPESTTNNVIKINQATVAPRILSSLLKQKVVIGKIVLNNPIVQSNKANIDNFINFINKLREENQEKEDSRFEIGTVLSRNVEFHISPEFQIYVPNLLIELSKEKLEQTQQIALSGEIVLFEKEIELDGTVLMSSDKPAGELMFRIEEIDTSSFSSMLNGSKSLQAKGKLNFNVSDLISIDGNLVVNSTKGVFSEKSFAEFVYDLNYDKTSDTAKLNTLDFKVDDLVEGTFSGEVKEVIKQTVFNLTGDLDTLDLNHIMVKLFGNDRGILSGEFNSKDLKLSGSREKNSIQLTGNALLTGFKYSSDNEGGPSVSDVDCNLRVNQKFSGETSFPLSASGKCTAGEFNWDMTGIINDISAGVNLNSKNNWQDNTITLSSINSVYMDGSAGGTLTFLLTEGFGGGISTIKGNISGSNLNLEKTPKTIIPANIAGLANSAGARFEGGSGNYKADIALDVNNFLLKSNQGREFRVSKLKTADTVDFEYQSEANDTENSTQDDILIKGKDISYQQLSFEEYNIQSGTINDIDFLLELGNDKWKLDMSSNGSDFSILGHDVSLQQFSESLQIENSGREGFSGTVKGIGGRYKSTEFPDLSWEYNFIGDRVIVSNVTTQISTLGQFKTDELFVNIGNQVGGYPYRINFTDATFSGFEGKLNSSGIRGEIEINRPGTSKHDWQGNVFVKNTKIVSAEIENISNSITPRPGGIKLENVQGKFLGGDITGDIDIDTTTTPSGIETNLKLINASIDSDSLEIALPVTNLSFSGTLPNGGLPEGKAKLSLNTFVLQNESHSSKLNANIETETVAETLYIKEGFIRGINNEIISFTGEMNNSLNENRSLQLSFPEVQIPNALGILSPLVPEPIRDFKTSGNASMELEFDNLFFPESKWGGKLSLNNSSLSGNYGGAKLTVSDINGTITIKDNVSSKNPLALVMGEHLRLSKSIFQKYLKSFKDSNLEKEDLDFLTIKQIDYGILTFENVEVALEIDRQKINLRRFLSKLFRGSLYGAGLLEFNSDQSDYNLSLIFNEISLESISERLSPNQEYITGRLNGLLWLSGEGAQLNTIDGPFKFWSKKSSKEPRKIGQALLDQLGARERLVLGSYRSYDNADISGYIKDGLMTFKVFSLTNRVLGFKNLSIQADPVRNSITIEHLISVIRELARRSETGGPRIQTN